jgi:hypothetical protein
MAAQPAAPANPPTPTPPVEQKPPPLKIFLIHERNPIALLDEFVNDRIISAEKSAVLSTTTCLR